MAAACSNGHDPTADPTMTTSPPGHISLAKRDSYGFSADFPGTLAEDRGVDDGDDDQEEPIQAFAQDEANGSDTVVPTDFTYGLEDERILDSTNRGLIPDSSYGSHLRTIDSGEGQPTRVGRRAEDSNGDPSFPPDQSSERVPGTAALDSANASEDGSGAGILSNLDRSHHVGKAYGEDEFGDFQGAQVRTVHD